MTDIKELRNKLDSLTYDYSDFNDSDLKAFDEVIAELEIVNARLEKYANDNEKGYWRGMADACLAILNDLKGLGLIAHIGLYGDMWPEE